MYDLACSQAPGPVRVQVPRCSLSTVAFLLSELLQYTMARCASHEELVARLMNAGYEVGPPLHRACQLQVCHSCHSANCKTTAV